MNNKIGISVINTMKYIKDNLSEKDLLYYIQEYIKLNKYKKRLGIKRTPIHRKIKKDYLDCIYLTTLGEDARNYFIEKLI